MGSTKVSMEEMRKACYDAYGSWKWKVDVDKRTDNQIVPLYFRLIRTKIINAKGE